MTLPNQTSYYYKQCLETVKLILHKQWEIADKEHITSQDMNRAKILSDILSTVATTYVLRQESSNLLDIRW